MSRRVVFDTEAVVAFLYGESGHAEVADLLATVGDGTAEGRLAAINASEVFYLVARLEGDDERPTDASLRAADRDVRALERRGLSIERADWRLAGEVKAAGDISLADACAVALAHEHDAALVVGGDDDFAELPVEVELLRFRDGPG
ncbi:VapC toxin family PIN domain ribonuclease [Halobacteriales archaeon QS_6_71_20]|nr:MAG: VapC toxin family PIN domain ribonuclease [Halobacteriales archaeon QS_6_71_20]